MPTPPHPSPLFLHIWSGRWRLEDGRWNPHLIFLLRSHVEIICHRKYEMWLLPNQFSNNERKEPRSDATEEGWSSKNCRHELLVLGRLRSTTVCQFSSLLFVNTHGTFRYALVAYQVSLVDWRSKPNKPAMLTKLNKQGMIRYLLFPNSAKWPW